VVDDGRSLVVKYAPDSWLSVNGIRYQLIELRFHHPAEMKIDGKGADMAIHLLHRDPAGKTGIVAVPVVPGPENAGFKTLLANLPLEKGKELAIDNVSLNASALLPKTKGYYSFAGSLSTPPCTEGVQWYLMQTPIQATTEQISRIARVVGNNARPTQPRNDRDIVGTPK
jgi:carbonic anhydrase